MPAPTSPRSLARPPAESSWLRRFWIVLAGLLLCLAAGLVYLHLRQTQAAEDEIDAETYLPLAIKTTVGNNQFVVGQVSLLIAPEQEERLDARKGKLQAVINAALSDAYSAPERPSLPAVQIALRNAVNTYLPRKLRVREVLIQDLVVGM